jgi:hypothetical protein
MSKRALAFAGLLLAAAAAAMAEDNGWPKEIPTPRGTLLIYQPQIDRFKGNIVEGRAAMSFTFTGSSEPIFGAFWFKALLETDFDTRTARLLSIQVPRVKFADANEEKQKEIGAFLEQEIPRLDIPISIDRLSAAMAEVVQESRGAGDFKHQPPKIVFSYEPAVLLLYDGEPVLRDIEGHQGVFQRAINTPLPVVLDVKAKTFYLCGGEIWYTAADALGPWSITTKVPQPLLAMKKEADKQREKQEQEQQKSGDQKSGEQKATETKETPADEKPPKVVVATSPTELVVIFGEAQWTPIADTDLLYVSNSQGNLFKSIKTQQNYILLSGRWYEAASLDGPWAFVAPEKLPRDFRGIPEDSPAANVLASVPGTDAAKDALLDSQIPQTAVIKRSGVTLEVTYDGAPQFKPIEGTTMEYAVNTSSSVIKVGERYYCCHQGVWYLAATPQGPWQVADQVPDDIYTIPPSNPHYNTTYVHVYDSTPEVVYTGYYPGYVNSYVYGGCVVYGTGWYYPPYVSPYFYHPYYPTWGFGVGWNPWYGWGVGVSWGYGPFTISVGFGGWGGYGGWYGGGYYRPPYYGGYPPRPGVPPGYRPPGSRPGGPQVTPHNNNLYASPQNRARNAATPRDRSARPTNRVAQGGANNVYTDRNGDVYRRNNDGSWQQRDRGSWSQPDKGLGSRPGSGGEGVSTRPATGAGSGAGVSTRPSTGGYGRPTTLESDYQARSRGSSRTSTYRGSMGGSRGYGGGGRRR